MSTPRPLHTTGRLAGAWFAAALAATALLPVRAAEPARAPVVAAAPATAPVTAAAPPAAVTPAAAANPQAPSGAPSTPATTPIGAPPAPATPAAAGLDSRIQETKADVIKLNRDLLVLEEELLFPANTQVAVFLSMDVGKLFGLESVQVRLNDKVVANHLYSPLEVQALHRGAVQRLHLGNLRSGKHELVAFFTGQGPHERDYKRGTTVTFDKGTGPRYIELRIKDSTGKLQPEFDVKVWQ
ncbi:MAG: AraC family transcriptional regulator [Ideonella sp.]|jgi:hypothetical protein|nr:AraC family transcriptional regulator [Ideonella sp.]